MRATMLAGCLALLALTACGSDPAPPAPVVREAAAPTKPRPLIEVDPDAYRGSVEMAMRAVPENLRGEFQKLLVCTMRKNQATGSARPLDADMVRELTATLKADPSAASICQTN